MNDSNSNKSDDNQTDYKTDVPDTKDGNKNQTRDIYERFLNRSQNMGDTNANVGDNIQLSDKSSAYEPLNNEELQLFASRHAQETDSKEAAFINVDNNVLNKAKAIPSIPNNNITFDDNIAATDINTNSDAGPINVLQGRKVASKKSLIIAGVCGLLMSVPIIALLNVTGVLTVLTVSSNSDNTETSAVNAGLPAANTNTENLELNLDKATVTGVSADAVDKVAKEKDTVAQADNAKAEIAISYEDFREEAQSTLYRETKD